MTVYDCFFLVFSLAPLLYMLYGIGKYLTGRTFFLRMVEYMEKGVGLIYAFSLIYSLVLIVQGRFVFLAGLNIVVLGALTGIYLLSRWTKSLPAKQQFKRFK